MLKVILAGFCALATTLIGAWAGAAMAFRYQRHREEEVKRNDQIQAVVAAQHALYFMWRLLAYVRYTYLDPQRDDEDNRHKMLGKYHLVEHRVPIDFNSLTFLFQRNFRGLLSNIFIAERAFLNAVDAVRTRNDRHTAMEPKPGSEYVLDPETKMVTLPLDPLQDEGMKITTNALYVAVDGGMVQLERAFSVLRQAAKSNFPEIDFFLGDSNLTEAGFYNSQKKPQEGLAQG